MRAEFEAMSKAFDTAAVECVSRYERGKDRPAALALAREARAELAAMGDATVEDIDEWLR